MRAFICSRAASRCVRALLRAVAVLVLGCRDAPADPPPAKPDPGGDATGESTGADSGSSGSSSGEPPPGAGGDLCDEAERIARGTVFATLRGRASDRDGACGRGGPDVFFVIDTNVRADVFLSAVGRRFEPVIGVLPSDCGADWDEALLCTTGTGGWIPEVAAGTRLVVSVAASPDDPGLALPPHDGADPLDFELSVRFRSTHAAGEPCTLDGEIRCTAGTACLPAPDGAANPVCTLVPGSTCEQAIAVDWDPTRPLALTPTWQSHGDAHVHSCGGARTPEVVYRIATTDPLPADATVVITAERSVLLAARGPGCLPREEIACGDTLHVAADPTAWSAGVFLFVELDDPSSPPSPVQVELEIP